MAGLAMLTGHWRNNISPAKYLTDSHAYSHPWSSMRADTFRLLDRRIDAGTLGGDGLGREGPYGAL